MKLSVCCTTTLVAFALLALAAPARAALVQWSVDSSVSYVRLNIPDQISSLGGTNVTLRVRNANNSAWSDAGGRRAPLGGTIATEFSYGSSISFLSGQHNLFALESGSHRPNPAAFDPGATNVDNPDGQYTDTSGAPAAFAGKLRPFTLTLSQDLGYFSFRDVSFNIASGVLPLDGSGAFAGGSNQFGIDSAVLDVDALSAQIVGQIIPDLLGEPVGSATGLNTLGGAIITPFGDLLRVLTLEINTPFFVDLNGVPLQMSLTGQIVAYPIPEPSSILIANCAIVALVWAGRRRLRRKSSL